MDDTLKRQVGSLLTYLLTVTDTCEMHENLMGVDPPVDEDGREWWDDNVMNGGQKIVAIDYHALTMLRDVVQEWQYQDTRKSPR